MDLLSRDTIKEQANDRQLKYLRLNLKEEDLKGVDLLIQENKSVFRKYYHHMEAVFSVLLDAPNELHMKRVEESVITYLKEQGVGSTWISMTKGSLKLRKMIKNHRYWYSDEQVEILSSLESEKAYLASRMTVEGQRKLCDIHKLKGGISVREVRHHLKDHQFDSSSIWKDQLIQKKKTKSVGPESFDLVAPNRAVPREVLDLVNQFSVIIENLSELTDFWEKNPRVHSMVDRDLLIKLTKAFCVEWYEDPDPYGLSGHGFFHQSPHSDSLKDLHC